MKNFLKMFVLILCGALCAVILSCGSTGGAAADTGTGPGVLATGEWMAFNDVNDKGSSTSTITSAEEVIDGKTVMVHHVVGNVTTQFQYGFAGWGLDADTDTIERYKTAKVLSFWIKGDGKAYSIKFKTSNVRDYGYFEYRFATEADTPLYVEVPITFFMQPSWAEIVRKNQLLVTGVEWQTHESWRKLGNSNPFEIKIWNFMVHQ
ncbi:MAG: CIA30 family protein [Treponema sp.]|nr:CIA30 family protein [Treponema sp.]